MIIIDVEIKKAILGRGETPIPGIEYCKGWRDFDGMGIACVCTYDINTGLSRVFLKEDLDELAAYVQGKTTAGFNTNRFDNNLLAVHGVDIPNERLLREGDKPAVWVKSHYDILEEIWIALGLNPDKFNPKTHGGWGLDAVCQATLGIAKTSHGALAPVWWQQGKRGKVIDYCLNDVWMEAQLLQWIIGGGLVARRDFEAIRVRPPRTDIGEPYTASSGRIYEEVPTQVTSQVSRGVFDIGKQYGEHQAKAFAAVPDSAGVAAVSNEQPETQVSPGGLGIIR